MEPMIARATEEIKAGQAVVVSLEKDGSFSVRKAVQSDSTSEEFSRDISDTPLAQGLKKSFRRDG